MNIKKLKALRELETTGELCMSDYDTPIWCGFAHCHAGWERVRASLSPDLEWDTLWKEARESLNLNISEAEFLFASFSHFDYSICSVEEGKARLDYMIANGTLPENWAAWALAENNGVKR